MLPDLPLNDELTTLAARCVWYKSPADALKNVPHFTAHVLTHGTLEDVRCLRRYMSDADLHAAMDNAPAGIYDGRSWNYWSLMLDRDPAPLPVRELQ